MVLTPDNYHSDEARALWISSSDVKLAMRCEAMWAAQDQGKYRRPEGTAAFAYGHLFEEALSGNAETYIAQHPELTVTRGTRKGELYAEYAGAVALAAAVRRSAYLAELIDRCRKQVILTGELCGLPVRVMMDLVDEDGSIYDIKSAKDFRETWDNDRQAYLDWWEVWKYPAQLWIYREIARQNGLTVPYVGLIAGSKSNLDVQAIQFSPEMMDAARADVEYTMRRMECIRRGEKPDGCGHCEWCLSQKKITSFEVI